MSGTYQNLNPLIHFFFLKLIQIYNNSMFIFYTYIVLSMIKYKILLIGTYKVDIKFQQKCS
jgi:hypothetical protein